ncbi:MAG: hypothetical protein KAX49_20370, partial [Halanaerobiales bacterium]|nr:hypothetical protein [Halanaerobiales bacterium]
MVEIIRDGFNAAKVFGKSLLVLDRYFLSISALKTLAELNENEGNLMHILTKAKMSCIVYTKLDLDPMKMIKLYAYRFKIECTFRELKQVLG